MKTKLKTALLIKPVAIILAISIFSLSFTSDPLILRAGTPIILELTNTLDSDQLNIGQSVDFRVNHDVIVNKITVIKAGSIARGQITRAAKSKALGRQGYVDVMIKNVQAIDGQFIPLAGNSLYREGEDKEIIAWGLGVFVCFLFLFTKGEKAIIPAGTTVYANVAMDIEINKE